MKFALLEEGGEITGYNVEEILPWEDMTPEQQQFTLLAWIPETEH